MAMVQARSQPETSDADLVHRFKNGDERAYAAVVERYSQKVLTLCQYFLKDPHEAHDVGQEVFIKIYRGLKNFRGDAKLSTWIHTIAINTCKNKMSMFKRWFLRNRNLDDSVNLPDTGPSPEEDAVSRERREVVRREITRLPEKFREIIILKDIQERSYDEIGVILGLTQGTVKSRLHRARDALGERLRRAKAL